MRVIIKVKKDLAHGLLQLLKLNGFKPEPDRPVTIDFRMTSCVLMGELEESQLEDTRLIRAVESLCEDLRVVKEDSIFLPKIPEPPAYLAKSEAIVRNPAKPPPIPAARPSDPSKPEFYKRTAVPLRSLDHKFDFSDEDAIIARAC